MSTKVCECAMHLRDKTWLFELSLLGRNHRNVKCKNHGSRGLIGVQHWKGRCKDHGSYGTDWCSTLEREV